MKENRKTKSYALYESIYVAFLKTNIETKKNQWLTEAEGKQKGFTIKWHKRTFWDDGRTHMLIVVVVTQMYIFI